MQLYTLTSPAEILQLADSAAELRNNIDWFRQERFPESCRHIDNVPAVMRGEAVQFLQKQGQNLRKHDFNWFREAGKQLEAFAAGQFRLTAGGGHYGDGPRVIVPAATTQALRKMQVEHLGKLFLGGLKQSLIEIEESLDNAKKPGIPSRLFSKTARDASRALRQNGSTETISSKANKSGGDPGTLADIKHPNLVTHLYKDRLDIQDDLQTMTETIRWIEDGGWIDNWRKRGARGEGDAVMHLQVALKCLLTNWQAASKLASIYDNERLVHGHETHPLLQDAITAYQSLLRDVTLPELRKWHDWAKEDLARGNEERRGGGLGR